LKPSQKLVRTALALAVVALAAIFFLPPKNQIPGPRSTASACVQLRSELEGLGCPGTTAYDWGQLTYYRDDDARIAEAAAGNLPRIVFIGDSITYGWPGLGPKGRFKNIEVVNRGITSQLTAQMLLRFRQDVIDLHPQVVVILGGSNDLEFLMPPAVPVVQSNLASMAQLARANGIATVLSSIPPVSDYELDVDQRPALRTKTHPPDQIREINDWMKKFASERGCIYLDYYSSLADEKGFFKRGYSLDGLHPNDRGYAIMEKLVSQAIAAALR
jgi:lysophospholipase L1-like esterase